MANPDDGDEAYGHHGPYRFGNVYRGIHISGNARVHLGNSLAATTNNSMTDREVLIRSLSFPELGSRCNNVDPALQDTCDWFFNHEAYQQWQNPTAQRTPVQFLWIRGKPGSGKSTITKRAYLNAKARMGNDHVSSSFVVLEFFFNSRGSLLERTTAGFYRSTLHQLLILTQFESPQLLMEIQRKRRFMTEGWTWTENELKDMFSEFVLRANLNITIYIDALDECESRSSRPLIDFLCDQISRQEPSCSQLKLCVSSRHYPNITVSNCSTVTVEDFNGPDITKYIQKKLQQIGHNDISLCRQITSRCSGVFLWAVLVFQRLREALDDGEPESTLSRILDSMPRDLEELFSQLVESISVEERHQSCLVMMWVLFSGRPLELEELRIALAFTTPWRTQSDYERSHVYISDSQFRMLLNKRSRGLVEIRTQRRYNWEGPFDVYLVQFIHESVREFLLNHGGLQLIDPSVGANITAIGHDTLARSSLNYIRTQELEDPDFDPVLEFHQTLQRRYNLSDYAFTYALYHAREAEKSGLTQEYIVPAFSEKSGEESQCYEQWKRRFTYSNGSDSRLTPLHSYCHYGLLSCVKVLLNAGTTSFNQSDGLGYGLWLAVSANHEQIVQILLQNNANCYLEGSLYENVVYEAMSHGYDRIMELLVRGGANTNVKGRFGSPLIFASMQGKREQVQLLLDHNANVQYSNEKYGDALLAASVEGHPHIVRTLLDHGAQIKVHNQYADGGYCRQSTHALLEASAWGYDGIVEMLAEKAIRARLPMVFFTTALKAAESAHHPIIIQKLETSIRRQRNSRSFRLGLTRNQPGEAIAESDFNVPSGPQSRREIEVFVKTLTSTTIMIKIRQNVQCIALKELIQQRQGTPPDLQYLVFNLRWIPEREYLSDRGIHEGSLVHVLLPIWNFRKIHR